MTRLVVLGAAVLAARVPQLGEAAARSAMAAVAARVSEEFSGAEIYVSAAAAEKRSARDAAIRLAFSETGPGGAAPCSTDRARQLAKQHGLSVRRVRAIVARQAESILSKPGGMPTGEPR